jgi:GxxExxY protein
MPSAPDPDACSNVVLSAFYEVYNGLKFGYLEQCYVGALAVEFQLRGIRFEREVPVDVHYRDVVVGRYRADFIVEEALLVEVKAGRRLEDPARWQTLNYLRATGLHHGLVLCFGTKPTSRRMIY